MPPKRKIEQDANAASSNQSVVKLQAATGAIYAGSNAVLSAVCCPCEKDELAIANGLCLACNRAKTPTFRETITTTDARKLYGIHDIDNVSHSTRRMYHRGYYSLFHYEDLENNAIRTFGSKKKWLEHIAPKLFRRQKMAQAKRRAAEEYQALIATFSEDFQTFTRFFRCGRVAEEQLRERAARLDSVCEKLTARSLDVRGYFTHTATFVLENVGTAEEVADSIERAVNEKGRIKREQEETKEYIKTLPKGAIRYLNCYYEQGKSTIEARYARYCELTAALGARDLELRSDSVLCRGYILRGEGAVDDIVDTMEEMNFLFTHTSYASECSSIIVENGYGMGNPYHYWSDSEDDDYYSDCGYHDKKRTRREEIKRRIKEQYLHNSRGMTLPAKWQRELESRVAASQTS